MRTISYDLYTFGELCPKAQNAAVELMTNRIGERQNEFDSDEYRATLKDIERVFEIRVVDFNVGYPGTYFRWVWTNPRWSEIQYRGTKYLYRYLNYVGECIENGKYYSKCSKTGPGHYKCRTSKVLTQDNYTLSGVWCDHAVDQAMQSAYEQARRGCDIEDFVQNMLADFFRYWQEDLDYAYSDEFVREELSERDEFEFLADGRPFS